MNVILGWRDGSTGVGIVHQAYKCSIPKISLHNQTVPTNTLCRHFMQRNLHYTAQGVIYCSNFLWTNKNI